MDAPATHKDLHEDEAAVIAEQITIKRDRLLASLTLIAGLGQGVPAHTCAAALTCDKKAAPVARRGPFATEGSADQ